MKILHALDHSLPLHSGYAFRTNRIFEAQRRRGWELVAVTSSKHEASWQQPCEELETLGSFRYYRSGDIRTRRPLEYEWRIVERLARRLDEVIEVERPDLLHAHSPVLTTIAVSRASRRHRIPWVYEVRAFWEDAAVDHGTYKRGSWKYRLVRLLETNACRRARGVAVLCDGIRRDLIARGIPPEKLSIVRNGIDPEETRVGEPDLEYRRAWNLEGRRVVGFVGSFYRYEGLSLLLDAFERIHRTRDDTVLVLVGGGDVEAELQARVRQLGLGGHVVLPGRIPHERIPGVYALMDVLAYPRLSTRTTELVTPLKPLEAMAMGKAFVASDVGGHRELVRDGETGILVRPGDPDALAGALVRLLDDASLRRGIESRQVPWVRREHSWDRTTEPYVALYATALGSRAERTTPEPIR